MRHGIVSATACMRHVVWPVAAYLEAKPGLRVLACGIPGGKPRVLACGATSYSCTFSSLRACKASAVRTGCCGRPEGSHLLLQQGGETTEQLLLIALWEV